jgi:nitroimidazol reductase NimA-like FMN-containing flavoprotein (pyridoxamine 5'-phosphate oxidase superfamily)
LRKIERDISDFVEIEYILHDATVFMIGLADGVEPDIVLVSFGNMDGIIYLHSAVCG